MSKIVTNRELWTLKLDWDDEVRPAIMTKFLKWMHALRLLKDIAVPRWIFGMQSIHDVSIHTFTDASENLYAAVIFLRVESGTFNLRLVFHLLSKLKYLARNF